MCFQKLEVLSLSFPEAFHTLFCDHRVVFLNGPRKSISNFSLLPLEATEINSLPSLPLVSEDPSCSPSLSWRELCGPPFTVHSTLLTASAVLSAEAAAECFLCEPWNYSFRTQSVFCAYGYVQSRVLFSVQVSHAAKKDFSMWAGSERTS